MQFLLARRNACAGAVQRDSASGNDTVDSGDSLLAVAFPLHVLRPSAAQSNQFVCSLPQAEIAVVILLRQNVADDVSIDVGQAEVATGVAIGEPLVVDSQEV